MSDSEMPKPTVIHLAHRHPVRAFVGFFLAFLAAHFLGKEIVDVLWNGRSAARLWQAALTAAIASFLLIAWVRLSGYQNGDQPPAA